MADGRDPQELYFEEGHRRPKSGNSESFQSPDVRETYSTWNVLLLDMNVYELIQMTSFDQSPFTHAQALSYILVAYNVTATFPIEWKRNQGNSIDFQREPFEMETSYAITTNERSNNDDVPFFDS